MQRDCLTFLLAAMLAVGCAMPAQAADVAPRAPRPAAVSAPVSPWAFNIRTYGWLAWVNGDATVRGRSVDVSASPGELLEHLDWEGGLPVWMSYAEARYGRFSLFNDINYSRLAADGEFLKTASARGVSLTLAGRIEADYTQLVIEGGATYELWSSAASGSAGAFAVDLLGGVRYWNQRVNVSADLAATLAVSGGNLAGLEISGSRVFARSGSVDWVDPIIGMRLRHTVAPGQTLTVRGDVGGFGVGSQFTWHAIATYDVQLLKTSSYAVDAYLGYKALYVDYSEGEGTSKYRYDALQHGPVIGLSVRF
jgi:hypothetical protein